MRSRTHAVSGGLLVLLATSSLAACGSSKPAFCADRGNLRDSVSEVRTLASQANLSGLRDQVGKIESNATKLVDSAKSDFPNEATKIDSAVKALRTTVDALPESPSTRDYAGVGIAAASAGSAVKSFVDATNSKCS